MQRWIVGPEEEGRTLRDVLLNCLRLSWSALKSAKWSGGLLVNGAPASVRTRLRRGDTVEVRMPDRAPVYVPRPYPLPLSVPWEDKWLMVVDKPPGLASQSSARQPDNSLENAVYSHLGCPEGFIYRPVNRLDRGTGGLMVIAKDGHTQDLLQRHLHSPDFLRAYLALTEGIPWPPEGVIDLPLGKEDAASLKGMVRPDGKPARTRYRVLREMEEAPAAGPGGGAPGTGSAADAPADSPSPEPAKSGGPAGDSSGAPGTRPGKALVRLELETGRTHQIRVHLAALGCPVWGDFLYGREQPEEFPGCFALHSAFLRFLHPHTGEVVSLRSIPAWAGENALPDPVRDDFRT